MDLRANERVVWMNGEFIPESQALVPFRDRSFIMGDGAFDTTRTFRHRIFKLDEHLARFYRTMRSLRLDATMPVERLAESRARCWRATCTCCRPRRTIG